MADFAFYTDAYLGNELGSGWEWWHNFYEFHKLAIDELEAYLCSIQQQDSAMYIALHADQDIPYRDIVNVLDIANQHKMKIVLATKK